MLLTESFRLSVIVWFDLRSSVKVVRIRQNFIVFQLNVEEIPKDKCNILSKMALRERFGPLFRRQISRYIFMASSIVLFTVVWHTVVINQILKITNASPNHRKTTFFSSPSKLLVCILLTFIGLFIFNGLQLWYWTIILLFTSAILIGIRIWMIKRAYL